MSTSVMGFKPPDVKFRKMLKAYRACEEAGVDIPDDVDDFFGGEPPEYAGVVVHLNERKYASAVRPYKDDTREGYEVLLDELPEDIRILRFVNSW